MPADILPFKVARLRLPKGLYRFLRYTLVGGVTFGIDLSLLALATQLLHIPYPPAVFMAFFIGASLNYVLSRRFVFHGSQRTFWQGYINMVGVAAGIALTTAGLTVALTETLNLNFLLSRILVAGIIGIGNYMFNLYINFRVAGQQAPAEILQLPQTLPIRQRA